MAGPRSVALIGPHGSGKSTLFDALMAAAERDAILNSRVDGRCASHPTAYSRYCAELKQTVRARSARNVHKPQVTSNRRRARRSGSCWSRQGCQTERRQR
ncbi:MAG: ATP-binding protein [Methylocella sp.]